MLNKQMLYRTKNDHASTVRLVPVSEWFSPKLYSNTSQICFLQLYLLKNLNRWNDSDRIDPDF